MVKALVTAFGAECNDQQRHRKCRQLHSEWMRIIGMYVSALEAWSSQLLRCVCSTRIDDAGGGVGPGLSAVVPTN